jgi:hypothetical protein
VFASNDISQPADVSIGDHTFFQVDWTSLATLQLPLTFAFSISLAYENVIKIASSTFAWELPNRFNAMPNLTDLYLSTSNPTDDDYVWNDTFNNVDNNEQIQIHGYTNRPNWFNTSWFPNATWSVN